MIWGSESWDITCRSQEMGIIENGKYAGETFESYIAKNPISILGTRIAEKERFPLLIKIINAEDILSVQVHPNNTYARSKNATDSGKSEMWYVISPPHDGYLIIGLKPEVSRESLALAYKNGTVEDCLNRSYVKTGDIVNIPAGLVHALTPGAVIAEVQQNSDITYRLYDYNRLGADGKPRPLHVEDALAVADFERKIPVETARPISTVRIGENQIIRVLDEQYFTISKYNLAEPLIENSDREVFSVFTCVDGSIDIVTPEEVVNLPAGRSVFVPAMLGSYTLRPNGGNAALIKSEPK